MSHFLPIGNSPDRNGNQNAEQIAWQTVSAIGDQTRLLLLDIEGHIGAERMRVRLVAIQQYAAVAIGKMDSGTREEPQRCNQV